jgi:hypothetical protein
MREHHDTGTAPQSTHALFSGSLPSWTTTDLFADSLIKGVFGRRQELMIENG